MMGSTSGGGPRPYRPAEADHALAGHGLFTEVVSGRDSSVEVDLVGDGACARYAWRGRKLGGDR
jgi:hypothetical protein